MGSHHLSRGWDGCGGEFVGSDRGISVVIDWRVVLAVHDRLPNLLVLSCLLYKYGEPDFWSTKEFYTTGSLSVRHKGFYRRRVFYKTNGNHSQDTNLINLFYTLPVLMCLKKCRLEKSRKLYDYSGHLGVLSLYYVFQPSWINRFLRVIP